MKSEDLELQGCSLHATSKGLDWDGWLLRTNVLKIKLNHEKHLLSLEFFLPDDGSVVYEGIMEVHVEASYPKDGRIFYIQPVVPGINALQIHFPAAISCPETNIILTPTYRIAYNNAGDQRDLIFKLVRIKAN